MATLLHAGVVANKQSKNAHPHPYQKLLDAHTLAHIRRLRKEEETAKTKRQAPSTSPSAPPIRSDIKSALRKAFDYLSLHFCFPHAGKHLRFHIANS